jgi:tetratricopeptide (TPR) repeat protein
MRRLVFDALALIRRSRWRGIWVLLCLGVAGQFTQTTFGQVGVRGEDNVPGSEDSRKRIRRTLYRLSVTADPPSHCDLVITLAGVAETGWARKFNLTQTATPRLFKGKYKFAVNCEGFEPYSKVISIPDSTLKGSLTIPLKPLLTSVTVQTTPAQSEVFLNGKSQGLSGSDGILRLPPLPKGRFDLMVRRSPEYLQKRVLLSVPQDGTTIHVELERDPTLLKVALLEKNLAEEKLEEAVTLFASLINSNPDISQLAALREELFSQLNRRSIKALESMKADGLHIPRREIAALRRLYQLSGSLESEKHQGNVTFNLFVGFWELKWIDSDDIASDIDRLSRVALIKIKLNLINSLRPNNAYIHFDLGWTYKRLGDLQKAELAFHAARAILPQWTLPYEALGLLTQQQAYAIKQKQQYRIALTKAAAFYQEAIKRDKRNVAAYAGAIFCYADAAQPKKGIGLGLETLSIAPRSGSVKYALGYAYFADNQFALARRYFEEAISATEDPVNRDQVARIGELLDTIKLKGR